MCIQACTGSYGSRRLRFLEFQQSAHEGGKVFSPSHPLHSPLPPGQYPWYALVFEAEWTPGPQCGWKDQVEEDVTPAGIYLLPFRL